MDSNMVAPGPAVEGRKVVPEAAVEEDSTLPMSKKDPDASPYDLEDGSDAASVARVERMYRFVSRSLS